MITVDEAKEYSIELLSKKIDIEEKHLQFIKEIYQDRCQQITLKEAERMSGEVKEYTAR